MFTLNGTGHVRLIHLARKRPGTPEGCVAPIFAPPIKGQAVAHGDSKGHTLGGFQGLTSAHRRKRPRIMPTTASNIDSVDPGNWPAATIDFFVIMLIITRKAVGGRALS